MVLAPLLVMLVVPCLAGTAAETGPALFHARRYAEAERALRARVAARSTDSEARLYLARTLIELSRIAEALTILEPATDERSASADTRYQAGLILRQLAERRFADLEAAAPGSPAVLELNGQQLERRGDSAAAMEQYRAAAKLDARRPGIHYAIGNLHWRARDLESAERELRMELETNPRHGMAQFRLGQVFIARGDEAAASGPLEAAAQAMPGNLDVLRELGKAYRKSGRQAEARRVWEQVARARPADAQVHFLLGGLYRETGEAALADAALARHRKVLAERRALSERR